MSTDTDLAPTTRVAAYALVEDEAEAPAARTHCGGVQGGRPMDPARRRPELW